jgi:hypothetical protein
MQGGKGKAARKWDEITATPSRGQSVEVTPSLKANEREQAQAKKIKQTKKKGLEDFFGKGPRVPPPSKEGSPIDAARKRRVQEGKADERKEGEGKRPLFDPACLHIHSHPNEGGEGGQKGAQTKSTKQPRKSSRKGSDDELSRQSKRTRSDDEGSAHNDSGEGKMVNLEAIKGSLRKKGQSTPSSKGSEKVKARWQTWRQ